MKTISVKKGTILQRKGDLNSKVYEVESGLIRSYTIDEKGKEHIYVFAPEDWIIGDAGLPTTPCQLYIDAIEDSVLHVYEKDPELGLINKEMFRRRMEVLQNRIMMLLGASAIQRYEQFIEQYPDIVRRVPQRMIAAFLGVTPQALSKLKGERKKKN
ncbi:MAG: Crp/Fnr family transcriptional regulator [Bacteroidota bacterium]